MAGSIYTYDFDDNDIKIINQVKQEEIKQEGIDHIQNINIQYNTDLNNQQTVLIHDNFKKDFEQDMRMDDIEYQIQHISGGTATSIDAGTW